MNLFIEFPGQQRTKRPGSSLWKEPAYTPPVYNATEKDTGVSELTATLSRRDVHRASAQEREIPRFVPKTNPISVEAAYAPEFDYAQVLQRCSKRMAVLRAVMLVILVPVALGLLFVASFCLSSIAHGARPEQVGEQLTHLVQQISGLLHGIFS
ncbi:hypothetical protein KPC83_00435 [Collinsella sp. zg1085]|uniref:hypothetical protein n=1 Tax=Collinsella sp. zg1085 TaxID=2844380 RepID=UPI001C0B88B3|nr:hypothetical protein [Collinsella sp. zg1085]QWT17677.1 hypothetical protein KPC83_00435 [Collinsella sp. zg1085]